MKRILILFVFFYFICFTVHVDASNAVKVYLFDELVDMDNPVIVNGNTLVPLRRLFEQLGADVTWIDSDKTVIANKGDTEIKIQIGNTNVTKNGQIVTLEEPANIINDKTYVPLRFVAEAFNQDVTWDKDNNAIHIGKALTARDISKLISPSVVYIETKNYDGKVYSGSGFIIDKTGIVVTNYHVIDMAKSAIVKLVDGSTYEVSSVINYDAERDVSILKITANKNLPTVTLGDSDKDMNGDKVFAIGSPLGLENSITDGLISNSSRMMGGFRFIQISAPISHGNSGGPLINYKGEVIGINTLTVTEGQNINFSIPINDYKNMYKNNLNATLEQVFNYQHVIQYHDGLYIGDKKNNVPDGFGIMNWNNGEVYSGQFINGVRSGKGKYTWANGGSYDGDWVNGQRQGFGKDTDGYGNVYEGPFNNNLANGKGHLQFSNGDSYTGDFLNGMMNGNGTYTFANGKVVQGIWVNGTFYK